MTMTNADLGIKGLTEDEVMASRTLHGSNRLDFKKENRLVELLADLVREPMILLLLVASAVYFVIGDYGDGLFMVAAIILVSLISFYQDRRTRDALDKLKEFIHPAARVIRDGELLEVDSTELVVGDKIMVEEGATIPADGTVIHANDFSVNESIVTGESLPVFKETTGQNDQVYGGTLAASGLAVIEITAVGINTKLGSIGKSMEEVEKEKTPLEIQIGSFVKKMVLAGGLVFLIVWAINYAHSRSLLDSLLKALTLAMSILPEEIPVAFTTFMALGAWRLMKMGIVVKQMKTVETLGSATVICVDKTGTLTENRMQLTRAYVYETDRFIELPGASADPAATLITTAMWASEPIPFDPMEKSIHALYAQWATQDLRPQYRLVHEYPIGGKPPMMTHVFENAEGQRIVAAKGAPEAILAVSGLSTEKHEHVLQRVKELGNQGYRVLGVGRAAFAGDKFPDRQQDFQFDFLGLVAFNDPPKANIAAVLDSFYDAGIAVKIVTGDNAATTGAIARQVNFRNYDKTLTGDELMQLDDRSLQQQVKDVAIFSRMFPEAKLRIINALKKGNEIVAMTGDGVNDGPALKAAHIGIAMGNKGTEIAKRAASLILIEDDLSKMVEAVAMGRKIYSNLKKAIQYIISIHIPIILTVFVPLALGWVYPNIFTPVHVIFFELIMGPTCSIIYENEPIEKNTMLRKPRPFSNTFFNWRELATSVLQGLVITCGTLFCYQWAVKNGSDEYTTRTMVFLTLISSNVFLTLVNRSFYYSMLKTIQYRNRLVPLIIAITVVLTLLLIYVPLLAVFFRLTALSASQLAVSCIIGFLAVVWYEAVKFFARSKS